MSPRTDSAFFHSLFIALMLDLLLCIPIVFGCPTRVSPDGNQGARICPRCHNASMFAAKSRKWFEFCFVPLIPFKSRHVWMCGICQLQTDMQPGWEPPLAQPGYQHPNQYGAPPVGGPQNYAKGYQPGYVYNG